MKKGWLIGPVMYVFMIAGLFATWMNLEPSFLVNLFDQGGYSPVEIATIPFFFGIVPAIWLFNPFEGSKKRRIILALIVSVVALMAIVKELDLHNAFLHYLYPEYVTESGSIDPAAGLFKPSGKPLTGTPFKMRVLTNAGIPLAMKCWIVSYFVLFFGFFAAGFAYLFPTWVKGVFKLDAASWSWGCFGASGVMVQLADRIPAWLGHAEGLGEKHGEIVTAGTSLCTCLEEGGELMIAVFALVTIFLGFIDKDNREWEKKRSSVCGIVR